MTRIDFNQIQTQLNSRISDRMSRHFHSDGKYRKFVWLESRSDQGVIINGGRRGSEFGPEAIYNVFSKFASHYALSNTDNEITRYSFKPRTSIAEFAQSQLDEAQAFFPFLENTEAAIHLGGGHDHIYGLLKALNRVYPHITVINIDPHLDTRTDSIHHSGTPFRQFAKECKGDFLLYQIGTHDFSNAESNYTELEKSEMKILSSRFLDSHLQNRQDSLHAFFSEHIKIPDKHLCVLSLDADALSASVMSAVSAVNPSGLSLSFVSKLLEFYLVQNTGPKIFGIYEYNPLFDDLSQKGARHLSHLIQLFAQNQLSLT